MPPVRLVLFIDAQNVYKGARRAFFSDFDPHPRGQIHPVALGNLIASRVVAGTARTLSKAKVYTGRPGGAQ